ncbi:MAG: hypothetical protein NZ746_12715 [Blastocatellia bacterium]|nr:hypothetical protein [Blastocatellia bacterium]MDW8256850.1 hypothetical protein [Acidobacteriota bacterium]
MRRAHELRSPVVGTPIVAPFGFVIHPSDDFKGVNLRQKLLWG